ncbi:putative transcriptional regulator [Treponema sp. JC4]|uniref:helix-turn-helix transcriptional regulator n=1 Tax=Treponema sp. JC4 TaxID=1124982 RepID=UPI00025AFBF2|nr:YafY family protein [Treponema sp. JC4]EID85118.1 putative transcriptional regulator [Treponema sp. JC4]
MQIDQLFEFVYVLIDKKNVTAAEMAKRFGVSTRTIYRWIDALSVSGVPVYALRGRGGGIAISEKYALDKTVLSEEEKLAILSSVKALNSLSGNSATAVNANIKAAEKLSRLVQKDTDWLEVDFSPWSPEGQGVKQLFGLLRDSILKKRQVSFDYFSGSGNSEHRIVHPWKLVYRGQAWYLLGWCTSRKSERYFKLSRMVNVKETGRAANVTIQDTGAIPNMEDSPVIQAQSLIKIKAKVSAKMAFYLLDSFACSEIKTHKDGSLSVSFSAPDETWLIGMLLSFGPDLQIISPKNIRKKIIDMANQTVQVYK